MTGSAASTLGSKRSSWCASSQQTRTGGTSYPQRGPMGAQSHADACCPARAAPGRRRRFAAPAGWLRGLAALALALAAVAGVASADDVDEETYTPRTFDGVGNNEANPDWGAVGTAQVGGHYVRGFLGQEGAVELQPGLGGTCGVRKSW